MEQLYHLFWMQYDKFIAHGQKSNIEKKGATHVNWVYGGVRLYTHDTFSHDAKCNIAHKRINVYACDIKHLNCSRESIL